MRFYITIGKCKMTVRDLGLSMVFGIFISVIILFWQSVGFVDRPLIHSLWSFLVSSLGFALVALGLAGFLETIQQVKNELQKR